MMVLSQEEEDAHRVLGVLSGFFRVLGVLSGRFFREYWVLLSLFIRRRLSLFSQVCSQVCFPFIFLVSLVETQQERRCLSKRRPSHDGQEGRLVCCVSCCPLL
jgi:hypothetical protein